MGTWHIHIYIHTYMFIYVLLNPRRWLINPGYIKKFRNFKTVLGGGGSDTAFIISDGSGGGSDRLNDWHKRRQMKTINTMLQYCLTHISAKWNFSLSTTFKSLVKTITLLKGFEVSTKGFKRLYFCRYFCKFLFQYQSPHTVSEFSMQNQAPAQCEVVAPNSLMLRFFLSCCVRPLD